MTGKLRGRSPKRVRSLVHQPTRRRKRRGRKPRRSTRVGRRGRRGRDPRGQCRAGRGRLAHHGRSPRGRRLWTAGRVRRRRGNLTRHARALGKGASGMTGSRLARRTRGLPRQELGKGASEKTGSEWAGPRPPAHRRKHRRGADPLPSLPSAGATLPGGAALPSKARRRVLVRGLEGLTGRKAGEQAAFADGELVHAECTGLGGNERRSWTPRATGWRTAPRGRRPPQAWGEADPRRQTRAFELTCGSTASEHADGLCRIEALPTASDPTAVPFEAARPSG